MLKMIKATLILFFFLYIAGSWASASFVLTDWSGQCRGVCSAIWVFTSLISSIMIFVKSEGDRLNE